MPTASVRIRSRFFIGMSLVMLLIVLIGFSPTLYLRAYFDVPEISGSLWMHGIALTAWFVWFVLQTTLVAVDHTGLHRRMGLIGVVVGLVVLVIGLPVGLNFV